MSTQNNNYHTLPFCGIGHDSNTLTSKLQPIIGVNKGWKYFVIKNGVRKDGYNPFGYNLLSLNNADHYKIIFGPWNNCLEAYACHPKNLAKGFDTQYYVSFKTLKEATERYKICVPHAIDPISFQTWNQNIHDTTKEVTPQPETTQPPTIDTTPTKKMKTEHYDDQLSSSVSTKDENAFLPKHNYTHVGLPSNTSFHTYQNEITHATQDVFIQPVLSQQQLNKIQWLNDLIDSSYNSTAFNSCLGSTRKRCEIS